ncbi:MAG TPA: DnaJ domain-containing protein [Candidatus Saccharimonadales bacterium]|nr:DnaJ domain-containing protein [Candidatus Saccharimonadales bacterium]
MSVPGSPDAVRTETRDYYAVLGAEPSATLAELRASFRSAVLRHHPDRSANDDLATRRTSILNRAWSELRDPLRRLHYDRSLERGMAATLAWPLAADEAPQSPRRRGTATTPSRWHLPQWRNVHGFRVPVEVFVAGPAAQDAWIIANQIDGQDWRRHRERYWLRYAARHYRDRGRTEDWLGAQERLVELDASFETLVRAELRAAYVAAGDYLRGAGFLQEVAKRYLPASPQRRWVDRELRALLAEYREVRVRHGTPESRAEAAELLLNYLEALEIEPGFADTRAAIMAHVRAGNSERAAQLLERAVAAPIVEPARWFSIVQLLTEAGELERASAILAEIARGEHPEALNRRRIRGDPARRIAAARVRLARARERGARAAAS